VLNTKQSCACTVIEKAALYCTANQSKNGRCQNAVFIFVAAGMATPLDGKKEKYTDASSHRSCNAKQNDVKMFRRE